MANLNLKLSMDEEVVNDFRESFTDQYEKAAGCILKLEENPSDQELLNELFRAFHTLKGNSNMCQLDQLTALVHGAEEVIDAVRKGSAPFEPIIGEIMLLVLDKIKEVSEELFHGSEPDNALLDKVKHCLLSIKQISGEKLKKNAAEIISLLSGQKVDENYIETFNIQHLPDTDQTQAAPLSDDKKAQLEYFQELATLLENKFESWKNRVNRNLNLALALNEKMNNPEDPAQLRAAVLLHDVAHAFIDETFLDIKGKLTTDQRRQIEKHPEIAAKLLEHISGWNAAREMILQHHERWDGSGYPAAIDGSKIRTGAQILAVVDAFESMTRCRPDRKHKRSILRAMTEINNFSGSQFSPHVTSVFNAVVRDTLAKN